MVSMSGKKKIEQLLPFEKELSALQAQLDAAPPDKAEALKSALEKKRREIYDNLSPWQRVQLARHPARPRMLDFIGTLFDDTIELHGDRALEDDPAMICGLGRFEGQTVAFVGQQKGVSTEEKVMRNFGMAHPSGYRKALRIFKMAERMQMPVVTFVDTPAAHPGIEAEQRGQGFSIARNLLEMSALDTPVFSVVLSEGGSGGAIGIAVADWVAMFEYAVYMICPPERCAEILWRDVNKKDLAANALKVTAKDLLELHIIDEILAEPNGGAHNDPQSAYTNLKHSLSAFIMQCRQGAWTLAKRQEKIAQFGQWQEVQTR